MTRIVYVGGDAPCATNDVFDPSLGMQTPGAGVALEPMPVSTTIFGVTFTRDQPVQLTEKMFKSRQAFEHAVKKLRHMQPYFKELTEDADYEEVLPKPKPTRRALRAKFDADAADDAVGPPQ